MKATAPVVQHAAAEATARVQIGDFMIPLLMYELVFVLPIADCMFGVERDWMCG